MSNYLLTYFADDFTGATDALDVLSRAGARTVLFNRPPTAQMLARHGKLDAVGVAGRTRSLSAEGIEEELAPALQSLLELRPSHIHYKVCSTFDSSPEVGSVGRAIDVGRRVIGSTYVPLIVGAPRLGRYCAFGNLFARAGVGQSGPIYRLDRHPSASKHPSTPMKESDIGVHLAQQTDARVALFDLLKLELAFEEQQTELRNLIAAGSDVVLFDTLNDQQLTSIGALIDHQEFASQPQFSVGSSGVEMALVSHWMEEGKISSQPCWKRPELLSQVLIVSGSCSPVTQSQISWALESGGFEEIAIDTPALIANEGSPLLVAQAASQTVELLQAGKSVIVHTSKGLDDPRIAGSAAVLAERKLDNASRTSLTSQLLGTALGQLLNSALRETDIRRICIAGGDTSSFVAEALAIESLEVCFPFALGAPLCTIHAPGSPADGRQVNFKGGQVGRADYFGRLLQGTI